MEWYSAALRQFAVFSGRARRKEYWMFGLINLLVGAVLSILAVYSRAAGVFSIIYTLAVFIPSIAVGVRRLHDTGRSGWMGLLALIPIVGGLVVLVFLCQDSQPGMNQYGPNPKELAVQATPA